jgi:ParB-like chromosome segregation protein Spo0J
VSTFDRLIPSPVLPSLPAEEYEALKNHIALNGVQQPILVTSSGIIIDGNHVYRAVTELGLRKYPIRVVGNLSEKERREMAIALNLYRRHLSQSERRHWLEELVRLNPHQSSRDLAAAAKVSQSTAARAKAKVLGTESGDSVEINGHNGKTYSYRPKPAAQEEDQTAEDATEKAADRKVTKTGHRVATPVVGVSLIAAELLGKAYSLLIEAEKLGITPDCIDILNKISVKTTALVEKAKASS